MAERISSFCIFIEPSGQEQYVVSTSSGPFAKVAIPVPSQYSQFLFSIVVFVALLSLRANKNEEREQNVLAVSSTPIPYQNARTPSSPYTQGVDSKRWRICTRYARLSLMKKYVNVRIRRKTYDTIIKKKRGRFLVDIIDDMVANYFA